MRLAALATLITDLVLLNLTTPYDCQVCTIFHARVTVILVLTCHNPKFSETLALVGVLFVRLRGENSQRPGFTLLGLFIPGPRRCLTLAYAPHVRLLPFSNTVFSQKQALMPATSVAIWNRNAVAVGIAATIWANNCAFFIQCKSPSLDSQGHRSDLVGFQVSCG